MADRSLHSIAQDDNVPFVLQDWPKEKKNPIKDLIGPLLIFESFVPWVLPHTRRNQVEQTNANLCKIPYLLQKKPPPFEEVDSTACQLRLLKMSSDMGLL